MFFCYLFEAKSIQSYIMGSSRLRDLIGASELVDSLCRRPLDDALAALDIPQERIEFSRRAGGAFFAFSEDEDTLGRLFALWPLVVQQYAPGLAFDHGLGSGATPIEADEKAREAMRADRSQVRPALPQAGPRVHRSQRTGRPAVKVRTLAGGEIELLDAATARQRRFAEASGLIERLRPEGVDPADMRWPLDLTLTEARKSASIEDDEPKARLMPFIGDARVIGVLHADGNGLGELLHRLGGYIEMHAPERLVEVYWALSRGLEKATERAAQDAVREVLIPRRDKGTGLLPARPVVLGGDDLTMILRADVALPFAQVFLAAFERQTGPAMAAVRELAGCGKDVVPERLTACAGIAYIKASQPFYLAARLAEGITATVKRQAKAIDEKEPPSSLAFHRVTTAMIDDYGAVLRRELSTEDATGEGDGRLCHSLGAYGLDPNGKLPALDDLLALQRLLQSQKMARGPAREVLTLIAESPAQAGVRWRRWRDLMGDTKRGLVEHRRCMEGLLANLLKNDWQPEELPYRNLSDAEGERLGGARKAGPLGDLHALMAVGNALLPDATHWDPDTAQKRKTEGGVAA